MFLIDATSSCMIEAKYCKNPPLGHRINLFTITLFTLCLWKVNHTILRVIFHWNNSTVIFISSELILHSSVDNRTNRLFNVVRAQVLQKLQCLWSL